MDEDTEGFKCFDVDMEVEDAMPSKVRQLNLFEKVDEDEYS